MKISNRLLKVVTFLTIFSLGLAAKADLNVTTATYSLSQKQAHLVADITGADAQKLRAHMASTSLAANDGALKIDCTMNACQVELIVTDDFSTGGQLLNTNPLVTQMAQLYDAVFFSGAFYGSANSAVPGNQGQQNIANIESFVNAFIPDGNLGIFGMNIENSASGLSETFVLTVLHPHGFETRSQYNIKISTTRWQQNP